MIDAKLLDTLLTVWSYHCEFQHAAWVCGHFCVALWSLSSQPRPGAVPCALSLPRDYVHSWLAILTPPCMRHQLSPPAGQKERTRVQANNGTKLEVERATMFNVYRENLCYHFFLYLKFKSAKTNCCEIYLPLIYSVGRVIPIEFTFTSKPLFKKTHLQSYPR